LNVSSTPFWFSYLILASRNSKEACGKVDLLCAEKLWLPILTVEISMPFVNPLLIRHPTLGRKNMSKVHLLWHKESAFLPAYRAEDDVHICTNPEPERLCSFYVWSRATNYYPNVQ
jgi:hypothetical protein